MPRFHYEPVDEGSLNDGPSVQPEDLDRETFMPATPTTTATGGDPWRHWNDSWSTGSTTRVTFRNTIPTVAVPQLLSDEEMQERRRRHDEEVERIRQENRERREREFEARVARMNAAKVRAEELLRLVLTSDELAHYDRTGEIIFTASDGRRYEITDGLVSNVHLLGDDGPAGRLGWRGRLASLCAHPNMMPGYDSETRRIIEDFPNALDGMPHRDGHVGQILQLRYDAPGFWRRANVEWHLLDDRVTEGLRDWHARHKFSGYDHEVDRTGLSDEARAAFPPHRQQSPHIAA